MTDAENNGVYTPLHRAALDGDTETVRALVAAGADIDAKDEDCNAPLHYAAWWGYTETARALVELGADINAKGEYGNTPLHCAALDGETETARALVELGANVNVKNADAETPLHLASCRGKTVRELVEWEAEDTTRIGGMLWHIRHEGHADTIRALAELGANVNAVNADCKTPLDLADLAWRWHDIRDILIEAGARRGGV